MFGVEVYGTAEDETDQTPPPPRRVSPSKAIEIRPL